MKKLAINGGKKFYDIPFETELFYLDETKAGAEFPIINKVVEILDRGILSGYRGNSSNAFWGGENVQKLEKAFEDYHQEGFKTHKALAVNSCTSALIAACAAAGVVPGDEVIVAPWSMSCSATAPLLSGGIPVFADIDENTFCLDINDVEKKITPKTKAIIAVSLFGHPINIGLRCLADKHNLILIEDAAQAIGSHIVTVEGEIKQSGTIGHISCFSFTQGKHINGGEGGMILVDADRPDLFEKCALYRNHGEAVYNDAPGKYSDDCTGIVGQNYRMTEIQAAIILPQIEQLFSSSDSVHQKRIGIVEQLEKELTGIPLDFMSSSYFINHVYYCHVMKYDKKKFKGVHRDKFLEAVKAELPGEKVRVDRGLPLNGGYIKPLYLMPVFQQQKHWAFRYRVINQRAEYKEGLCPVAERLWKDELIVDLFPAISLYDKERMVWKIAGAFRKVYDNLEELI